MLFSINSRYHAIETAKWRDSGDREVIYLRRRFIPMPKESAFQIDHVVNQNERLDMITARYLGNPEQFWRVCDMNKAMKPEEMTSTIGRRLHIAMMEEF